MSILGSRIIMPQRGLFREYSSALVLAMLANTESPPGEIGGLSEFWGAWR